MIVKMKKMALLALSVLLLVTACAGCSKSGNVIQSFADAGKQGLIPPFFGGIANSFQNNLVQENRYLLIFEGLKTTVIISVLSTILGSQKYGYCSGRKHLIFGKKLVIPGSDLCYQSQIYHGWSGV